MNKISKSMLIALLFVFAHGYAMQMYRDHQSTYTILNEENNDCSLMNSLEKEQCNKSCFIAINDPKPWLIGESYTQSPRTFLVNFSDATKDKLKEQYTKSDNQSCWIKINKEVFFVNGILDLTGKMHPKIIINNKKYNKVKK